ncbi:MAG TPA: GPW/gp25 family protein [Anaerolineae bacterium]|nr:GPW/gp25 family protein [Anaerolineae bacterium]HQI84247.1 GPW/gp25 family protein [Anaerolineae bacterium]
MNVSFKSKEFLGQGLAFPLQVNARGEIALVSGDRDIEQSIGIILGTRPGERVMRPEFGCRASELLFEPRNSATETLMQQYVEEALHRWEPRIDVQWVRVLADNTQDGAVVVEVNYLVKATHDQRSIVYPFFLVGEEGW